MPRALLAAVSALNLAVCLAAPFLYLGRRIDESAYKTVLLAASVAWFVFATMWVSRAGKRR